MARICSQSAHSLALAQSFQPLPANTFSRRNATGVPRHLLRPDIYPADLGPSPAWKGVDQGTQRVSFNQNSALQERAA
jgi:hypothetical protein